MILLYSWLNPFTPESDQCQNSPATSQEIWHHTVWRTWLFIAYSDEKWLYYKFSLHHSYNRFLKGWENTLFELRSERVKQDIKFLLQFRFPLDLDFAFRLYFPCLSLSSLSYDSCEKLSLCAASEFVVQGENIICFSDIFLQNATRLQCLATAYNVGYSTLQESWREKSAWGMARKYRYVLRAILWTEASVPHFLSFLFGENCSREPNPIRRRIGVRVRYPTRKTVRHETTSPTFSYLFRLRQP